MGQTILANGKWTYKACKKKGTDLRAWIKKETAKGNGK